MFGIVLVFLPGRLMIMIYNNVVVIYHINMKFNGKKGMSSYLPSRRRKAIAWFHKGKFFKWPITTWLCFSNLSFLCLDGKRTHSLAGGSKIRGRERNK